MSEEEMRVNETLPELMEEIKHKLPKDYGFVLLAFKFGEHVNGDRLIYASNGNRADVAKAMQEWIDKVDNDEKFGKDL